MLGLLLNSKQTVLMRRTPPHLRQKMQAAAAAGSKAKENRKLRTLHQRQNFSSTFANSIKLILVSDPIEVASWQLANNSAGTPPRKPGASRQRDLLDIEDGPPTAAAVQATVDEDDEALTPPPEEIDENPGNEDIVEQLAGKL